MTTTLTRPVPGPDATARPSRGRRIAWLLVVLALAVGATFGYRAYAAHAADVRTGTDAVSADEFAARTGIRVDLLGVTAQGGMIEFRYQVLDPDKASLILHDETKRPILVAEGSGQTLAMVSRPHSHKADLRAGGTYFFLMANTASAIHDGTKVTVIIGDVRLEHVAARA